MKIKPELKFKQLNTCAPGELIQLPWGGRALSIVAQRAEKLFVVALQSDVGGRAPYYLLPNNGNAEVLSYGDEYEIEINTTGPQEIPTSRLWEMRGAILIHGESTLMRIAPAERLLIAGELYLDLRSGELVDGPKTGNHATFAHWNLRLTCFGPNKGPVLVSYVPEVDLAS